MCVKAHGGTLLLKRKTLLSHIQSENKHEVIPAVPSPHFSRALSGTARARHVSNPSARLLSRDPVFFPFFLGAAVRGDVAVTYRGAAAQRGR